MVPWTRVPAARQDGMEIMQRAVEKRLQALLRMPDGGAQADRATLLRDVLLVQLAMRVGASLRGVYDDQDNLRTEEIARRIRQAAAEMAQVKRRRSHGRAASRPARARRPGWMLASLLMLSAATVTAVSALAIQMGLLPGL
jgi:hypothetical protein